MLASAIRWVHTSRETIGGVQNGFVGQFGLSGGHMVYLAQHSDEVLGTFLALAGRQDLMVAV